MRMPLPMTMYKEHILVYCLTHFCFAFSALVCAQSQRVLQESLQHTLPAKNLDKKT